MACWGSEGLKKTSIPFRAMRPWRFLGHLSQPHKLSTLIPRPAKAANHKVLSLRFKSTLLRSRFEKKQAFDSITIDAMIGDEAKRGFWNAEYLYFHIRVITTISTDSCQTKPYLQSSDAVHLPLAASLSGDPVLSSPSDLVDCTELS